MSFIDDSDPQAVGGSLSDPQKRSLSDPQKRSLKDPQTHDIQVIGLPLPAIP